MPTRTEIATAQRANIAGVPEPWRYTNGKPPNMRPQPPTEPAELNLKQLIEKRNTFHNLSRREQELLNHLECEQKEREEAAMVPVWAEQEREMALRRESGYQDWLAELEHANAELAANQSKLASLKDQLFDTKERTLHQPHGLEQIIALAAELPGLREMLPLLELEIKRSEKSLHEWRIYGEGIARKLHADLTLRVSEWRALRIAGLHTKIHQDLLKMFGSEPAPQLLDSCLKDSKEFKALQSPVTLPNEDSLNLDELKAAIEAVQGLIGPRESQPETAALDAAEAAQECNRTKAATRSKERHAVSR